MCSAAGLCLKLAFQYKVGGGIAQHKEYQAAHYCCYDVGRGGEECPGAQHGGIFKGKGRQGGVAAAEAGGEGEAQVGGFDEPGGGKPAEKPHEQAAAEVDDKGVPRHIYRRDSPARADEVAGEVAQHTTEETPASDTKQSLE